MMRRFFSSKFSKVALVLVAGVIGLSAVYHQDPSDDFEIKDDTPLWSVMTQLGKIKPHKPKNPDNTALVEVGRSLVEEGTASYNGKTASRLSKKFTCSSCHLSQPEHNFLSTISPEKRLRYADTADLAFLPGPTFYGMVNRIMFFNDDLMRKFIGPKASLLKRAHYDLRTAINACNQVFANGRKMKDWEIEAILMYMWSKELKIGELKLSEEDMEKVVYAVENNRSNARAVNILRRYYPEVYPATLKDPPNKVERRMVSPVISNFYMGRRLYEHSCLHCHENKRYSRFKLDYRQKTFRKLRDNFEEDKCSIYSAHRYDPNKKGRAALAPPFTGERMSDVQLQNLRYFISTMARMGDKALDYYGDNK